MNSPVGANGNDNPEPSRQELVAQLTALREKLREAEETLDAIRNGDVDAVIVSSADDTPRVYTLQTADESYRLLVQEMQEGALTLSRAGDILYCNARLAELVGEESERIIGGSLRRFFAETQFEAILSMVHGEAKGQVEILAKNGLTIPVHISFSALRGGHFDDAGIYCCIVTDLTEQRRTSDQLRATHEALLLQVAEREHTERLLRQSQKMEAVGQLTGGIAHDFNNLLMVISGGLSILDRNPTPERRAKIQTGMRQAAARGAALTRQLLAFSRQKELLPKAIAIPRYVEGMRELLDGSLGGDLVVVTEFDNDAWTVEVDDGELGIALLNLCVNARDAMPKGGTITIAARNRPDFAEFQLKGNFVELSVADTGEGMDAETISRCLEPFYTTKDIGKGSGLGLAQVYGFARGSGGTVQIDSTPGVGTKVSLYLPRATTGSADKAESLTALQKTSSPCTVLLVEDDVSVAGVTVEMLRELGYEVANAGSAAEGLRFLMAEHSPIGVILSDVMMPGGMDGLSFVRRLRELGVNTPVVLVSGYAESIRQEARAAGIALLAKPYRFEDLSQALQTALISQDDTATPAVGLPA